MLFRIGQNVIVADRNNFYHGREALIEDITSIAGEAVMTVSLPTTETGRVVFSLREEFCRPGLPGRPRSDRPVTPRHLINGV